MTNELCKLRNGIQDATLGHRKASRAIENRIVKMMTIKCRLLSPLAFSAAHTVSTSKFSLFPFVRQSQSHSLDRTPLFPFSMHPCTMHGGWKISTLNRVAAIRPTTKWQTREVFAISTYFRKFIFRFSVSDFQIIYSSRSAPDSDARGSWPVCALYAFILPLCNCSSVSSVREKDVLCASTSTKCCGRKNSSL